tara:strand:- start:1103 stop:1801 length:699 start_codon:yes stop_codon:yes gene_type:complete
VLGDNKELKDYSKYVKTKGNRKTFDTSFPGTDVYKMNPLIDALRLDSPLRPTWDKDYDPNIGLSEDHMNVEDNTGGNRPQDWGIKGNPPHANDAINQEIDWFNWARWKDSLEDSFHNLPENLMKYGQIISPFLGLGVGAGRSGNHLPGTLGMKDHPTGNVALKEQRDIRNEKNPQNGGMNIDMNDRTGPKKTSFNLLNFFGIPQSEGSFPTPGEPDYFEPQPGNVYEEGEQG